LAIHGVTLHAGVFDTVARDLAARNYYVIAPDLRGFGRWRIGEAKNDPKSKISFYQSRADLVKLLCALREQNSHIPIFCLGESLGANLAIWLASVCPDLIDGAVLSSPCIDRRFIVDPTITMDTIKAAFEPKRQVPIAPYAKRYLSEDKRIIQAYLDDPLMRKRISVYESLQSTHTNRSCLWFTDQIPAKKPILLIEGEKDKMYNADEAVKLVLQLPVEDHAVCMLPGLGHIHFETPYVHKQAEAALFDWLDKHTAQLGNELATTNLTRVDP
jgi:alpha-beta hydrolase superfamily lysophospholipase